MLHQSDPSAIPASEQKSESTLIRSWIETTYLPYPSVTGRDVVILESW